MFDDKLFQDDKDTKFESNSQLSLWHSRSWEGCFRTTKIQNLRAIHNVIKFSMTIWMVVSGRQRYKIWEQFTTCFATLTYDDGCFRTTKIQNLRAIHNNSYANQMALAVVSGRQRYKIWEQFTTARKRRVKKSSCFRTTKIQNLRAIHNNIASTAARVAVVSGRQRYKIWEQFTTVKGMLIDRLGVVSGRQRYKIWEQFTTLFDWMNAWFNVVSGRQRYKIWEQFTTYFDFDAAMGGLFQDDKDTKFESNSQQALRCYRLWPGCFRTTKIQNLRAIHNSSWGHISPPRLFQDDKDTKFESNSQQW